MAGIVDTHYTVQVDNSANDSTNLRYCCWNDDDNEIVVIETEESIIDLNKDYQEDQSNEPYITMPLTLLSFAVKDEDTMSDVGMKICCPTNMLGFLQESGDYGFVADLGSSENPLLTYDKDTYQPFGYYAAFDTTIVDSTIFKPLMEKANNGHTNIVLDTIVFPETLISLDVNDFMGPEGMYGGYGVTINNLIIQCGAEQVAKIIERSSDFINAIGSYGTAIHFSDSEGEKTFKEAIDKELIIYDAGKIDSSSNFITKTLGIEPPDVKKRVPKKGGKGGKE